MASRKLCVLEAVLFIPFFIRLASDGKALGGRTEACASASNERFIADTDSRFKLGTSIGGVCVLCATGAHGSPDAASVCDCVGLRSGVDCSDSFTRSALLG
ncbi:unnamed protein product [Echinostoma caproni]|uniref:Secreted protein n=1 Tax=Echinostoma caproni TaxID=27848 RepID=A0A183AEM3_9TREM|nr:unnamed protein product [Echinostoma caproni]